MELRTHVEIYIEILAGISYIKSKQKIDKYDEQYFDSKFK